MTDMILKSVSIMLKLYKIFFSDSSVGFVSDKRPFLYGLSALKISLLEGCGTLKVNNESYLIALIWLTLIGSYTHDEKYPFS
jgi:hypothetical protein